MIRSPMKKLKKYIDTTLEDWLEEEGILEEVQEAALKTTIALRLQELMKKQKLTQADVAKRMKASRAVVQRLLDPKVTSVTMSTLGKAAHAVGARMSISFDIIKK